MAVFHIQKASSTVNWTGKKVLGLHTGSINIESGFLELTDGIITSGEIVIDMTSIVISDIEDPKTNNEFLGHLQNDDFFSVDKFKTARLVITSAAQQEAGRVFLNGILIIKYI